MSNVTCYYGHELKLHVYEDDLWYCDMCGDEYVSNISLYNCKKCNFNACKMCVGNSCILSSKDQNICTGKDQNITNEGSSKAEQRPAQLTNKIYNMKIS